MSTLLQDVLEIFRNPDHRLKELKEGLEIGVQLPCQGAGACHRAGGAHPGIILTGLLLIQGKERWVIDTGREVYFIDLREHSVVRSASLPNELDPAMLCDFQVPEQIRTGGPTRSSVTFELMRIHAVRPYGGMAWSGDHVRMSICGDCDQPCKEGGSPWHSRRLPKSYFVPKETAELILSIRQEGGHRCCGPRSRLG